MNLILRSNLCLVNNTKWIRHYSALGYKFTNHEFNKGCYTRSQKGKQLLQTSHTSHQTTRNISLEAVQLWYIGLFESISKSKAVACSQDILLQVHDTTGLPWWATIMLATCSLRLFITLPLTLYQSKVAAKLELCKIEMNDFVKLLRQETAIALKRLNWSEAEAKRAYNISLKNKWKSLIERDNCHPLKTTLVFWFQLPTWVILSVTLRNMAYGLSTSESVASHITALEMSVGGVYWAPNLLLPDLSLVLPVTLGLCNLAIIELQVLNRQTPPTRLHTILTNVFRGVTVLMVPVAAIVPSSMSLFWATSSAFGLAQNLVLMSPRVKQLFGVPTTPSQQQHPYQHAYKALQNRWYCRIFTRH